MSAPDRPTDDSNVISRPKPQMSPTTLFCKPPTPESPDPFDDYCSPSPNTHMKTLIPDTGNCPPRFPYTVDRISFSHLFKKFAKFGDSKSSGETITLTNSDKWFRQAKVIDGRRVTITDTGIYFKQVAKSKKALNMEEYEKYLDLISMKKNISANEMKYKLSSCGPPATNRTTAVDNGSAVRRLTDHTRYTGTHKQRFDKTGKGRGREGRDDFFDNSGYVHGYKSQGTYSRFH